MVKKVNFIKLIAFNVWVVVFYPDFYDFIYLYFIHKTVLIENNESK